MIPWRRGQGFTFTAKILFALDLGLQAQSWSFFPCQTPVALSDDVPRHALRGHNHLSLYGYQMTRLLLLAVEYLCLPVRKHEKCCKGEHITFMSQTAIDGNGWLVKTLGKTKSTK
jgi:hypothetical protein